MRAGYLLQKLFKKSMKKLIIDHNRHVAREGNRLKEILEEKK